LTNKGLLIAELKANRSVTGKKPGSEKRRQIISHRWHHREHLAPLQFVTCSIRQRLNLLLSRAAGAAWHWRS